MARRSPFRIKLSVEDRRALETLARSYTLPYCDVIRARIVLYAGKAWRTMRSRAG
jgi:hypothetical protein